MALLEFLLLTPPATQPLPQSYDPLVITFTQGMETFAVAHEYGHVIKRHASPTMNIRLGADDEPARKVGSVPVLARSWKQEFEADEIGLRLVAELLKQNARRNESNDLRWVYTFKGALFFFRCLDLVEQAKAVRDTGKLPTPPSFAERVFLRAFADGKTSREENEVHKALISGTHPPAWLRLERANELIAL
jgi:Zn-dependent protease with chaperone function